MNMERVVALRRIMAENSLSAVLVTSRKNVFYLSGFDGDDGDLLITLDAAYILCDFRFLLQASMQSPLFIVKDIKNGVYNTLNEIIKNHGASKLGIEERELSYAAYSSMKKYILGAEIVPVRDMIDKMRRIKNQDEIDAIRLAAKIADTAFSDTVKNMKIGMSEIEVAAELEYNMRKMGARKSSFDTVIASGTNAALPHGTASSKKLEAGDFVVMDFGCIYGGYCSDMTRTVAMGEISKEQEKVYNAVYFTQLKALSKLKCGEKCIDVDAYSRSILSMFGLESYFGHGLGHGVGLEIHEAPSLNKRCEDILVPGMVVTVEPGVYLDGRFGVRIEDLVVIRDGYNEILTNSTKDLIII